MNINLVSTTFGAVISFLDSQHVRYVRGGVTLDATAVTADGSGIKKLPAGTFIGKQGNGKYAKYTAAVAASLITGVEGSNNAILWTAKNGGTGGNSIKIQLKNPGAASQPLKVTIESDTVVVSLATDAGSAITSTAAQVISTVNSALYVKDIITAANSGASSGTGVVAAVAATALAGAADANVTPTAILAEEVIFTIFTTSGGVAHADRIATAIDHGRVISSRLPVAPDSVVKANIPDVSFV